MNHKIFEGSFYQSLGSSYKSFYNQNEITLLVDELYTIYDECKFKEFDAKIISPSLQDQLHRTDVYQVIIVCNSMPFFTSKLRNTFYFHEIDVNRNIHFHPEKGKEIYYIELNEKYKNFIEKLDIDLETNYKKIITLTQDYLDFTKHPEATWLNVWKKEHNDLLNWILHEGYIWEGAYFTFQENQEGESFGNHSKESFYWNWFTSLPESAEPVFHVKGSNEVAFLGEGDLFYFALIHKKNRLLLIGSLSQKANHAGIGDIPILQSYFKQFIQEKNIEPFSGLGRTLRMMFNYIPTELLFILPKNNYTDLYKSFIERSFKYSLGSEGFTLNHRMALFVIFIPEKNWSEESSLKARKFISSLVPNSVVKHYSILRGSILQEFLLVEAENINAISIVDVSFRLEIIYRTWEEELEFLWKDRNQNPVPLLDFRKDYRAVHSPLVAVQDIEAIPHIQNNVFITIAEHDPNTTAIYALTPDKQFSLFQWVNAISSFNLSAISQRVYRFYCKEKRYAKSEFFFEKLENKDNLYERLSLALYYTMIGKLPSDKLSSILPITNLDVNGILFLKAMRDYCLQTRPSFNKLEFAEVLLLYPEFCSALWKYFYRKFHDGSIEGEIELKALADKATTLKEDEVLNSMRTATLAIVRTNFFGLGSKETNRLQGIERETVSFKIDSSIPISLPKPRPFREIFVYSSNFQGVHLRGGAVARGGLRFSDRPSDYRTEVLSLLKTQMVKNSLIVPVGSKGCFVTTKNLYATKETTLQEAYIGFVSSLVSLTDNRFKGEIVPFMEQSCPYSYDELDPYLVVAADKGTANMSDTANAISQQYQFWLNDAFASGGSRGYSHKEYGITAKGAWVTADRLLRNCTIDFRNETITVVGIGDMGGDVFGNGLLESQHFKLIAAFNHKHIFLDPNPEPFQSYEERKRLFHSKDSGWNFYDKSLLSKGGGVYNKTDKLIPISIEVQKALGIESESLSGTDLIRAILKAPVDLLYNGGIGTYIKSEKETHTDVGDPINNDLRINAIDLRTKVVSEGGNLGFTQAGRIEFDHNGGLLFTDALDNSGGVDLSDHEVNLKLLFSSLLDSQKISSLDERDLLLKKVAPDVNQKVLRNNALQSLAVNVDRYESEVYGWESIQKSVDYLVAKKILVPSTEGIPATPQEWDEWKEKSVALPRPALCVLLGYVKMELYTECLKEKLFTPTSFQSIYFDYFPSLLQEKFSDALYSHPLSIEILTTVVVNFYVNLLGISSIVVLSNQSKNKFEKFLQVISVLSQEGYYDLLNEVALLRDKKYEKDIISSVSSLRTHIRNKYLLTEKENQIFHNSVFSLFSEKGKSILQQIEKR